MSEALEINDEASVAAITGFFTGMDLPLPQTGEYYRGVGDKRLVFLSDHGLVIRITPEDRILKTEHPRFLKSVFNRSAGQYRIDIDPGIETPVPEQESGKIYLMLKNRYGIEVADEKPHNLGFLPGTSPPFAVAIDLDRVYTRINPQAVNKLTKAVEATKKILMPVPEKPEDHDPQLELYAPLRTAIAQAWPAQHSQPYPGAIRQFMELCLDFKKSGKLASNWIDRKNNYHSENYNTDTTETARLYTQKLHSPA